MMIEIEWIRGYCPVQATGTIGGLPFYFRARDDKWSLSIAETPDGDPIAVSVLAEDGFWIRHEFGRRGDLDASFMSHRQAKVLICSAARYYVNQKRKEGDRAA